MKKINVAELLRDCPRGMKLDCTMYEDVYFDYVDELNIIHCHIRNEGFRTSITFNQHGTPNSNIKSKCVIFPKGKTTWEGFVSPCKFNDGDVLVHTQNQRFIMSIYHKRITEFLIKTHCILWDKDEGLSINMNICCYPDNTRLATEEEKQKLFDVIKANGYKWNAETKTLDKDKLPMFKVGNRIKNKSNYIATIIKFKDDYYYYKDKNGCGMFHISGQDQWKLVSDKFDINTLVPFESRVLVRDRNTEKWKSNFWGFYDIDSAMNYPYECCGNSFGQCIPYEGNEHLIGTTNDCDEFYKTW